MRNLIKKILKENIIAEAKKSFFKRVSLPYDYNSVKDFVGYETMWKNYDTFTRNNAGGYYNHSLFFKDYITPNKTDLSKELRQKINKDFGSLDNFKRQFDEESGKVFGSGWCWLVLKNGRLKIVTTPNQDNPLMEGLGEPLLGLDVWEHAYYLNYMSDRKKYIKNFWKVVNWNNVSDTLKSKQ